MSAAHRQKRQNGLKLPPLDPPSLFSHSLLSCQPSSQLLLLLILPFPAFSFPRSLLRTLGFKQLGGRGDDTCGAVRIHGRCWLDYWLRLGLGLGSGSCCCGGGFGSKTSVIFQDPLIHVLKSHAIVASISSLVLHFERMVNGEDLRLTSYSHFWR